jgi:threonine dehydrogenase-like Zn-dependent dehydrogenase
MRATVLRDGKFAVEELDIPRPGPGQVLARVRSCGICGSDIHFYKHFDKLIAAAAEAEGGDSDPSIILGHEFVAEIVEFGPDTKQTLSVGDRVCSVPFLRDGEEQVNIGFTPLAPGAYAEYLLLTEDFLIPVPDAMSDDAAALAEPLGIGVHAVAKAAITPQSAVLVIGCGPIGLATIAALRLQGVEKIIATDYSPMRRSLASESGASEVVDPAGASGYERLNEHAGSDTVVFECVGRPGLMAEIINNVPEQTRIIGVGVCPGEDTFEPLTAQMKELMIQYVVYYTPEEFASALHALAEGKIDWRPWVTGKVNLDGIAGAFAELADPEKHAKILIEPWQEATSA